MLDESKGGGMSPTLEMRAQKQKVISLFRQRSFSRRTNCEEWGYRSIDCPVRLTPMVIPARMKTKSGICCR